MQAKVLRDLSTHPRVADTSQPPLIAHILYRFAIGGLENGVVNLINRIPESKYRHVIISLTDATDFQQRIQRKDVEIYCLNKKPGHDPGVYIRLWKLLRKLKPDITHTRNLAALEMVLIALLAGVKRRVHSEHGWGMSDLHGTNPKYQLLRRYMSKLTHRYIGLSRHITDYLQNEVGVNKAKLAQIYNGVDTDRFNSSHLSHDILDLPENIDNQSIVIGTVGRMEPVKAQTLLAEAFVLLHQECRHLQNRLRLVMIGDGELRVKVEQTLDNAGLLQQCWLPGNCNNIPAIMKHLDIFVLPSQNEGISNTILEAMASGLPVIATRVGGNPELVSDQKTGLLVPADNPQELMLALKSYVENESMRKMHGEAGYRVISDRFKIEHMINSYLSVYNSLI